MSPRRRAIAIGWCLVLGCASKGKPDNAAPPGATAPEAAAAREPSLGVGAGGATPVQEGAADEADAPMAAPPEKAEAASLDDLRAELDGYETRLREHGVRLRGYPPGAKREQHKPRPKTKKGEGGTKANTPTTSRDRCEDVCAIATAVCGLRDRICGLASVHEDETEYAQACERAERDCDRASEACDDCS